MVDADQHIHVGRAEGEFLVDIARAIGDDRHPRDAGLAQGLGLLGCLDPAAAFLVGKRTFVAVGFDPLVATQELCAEQAQKRLLGGVHGDRGMELQALGPAMTAMYGQVSV